MCTVILLYKIVPDFPIVIAANRDEFIHRSALPPHIWSASRAEQTASIFAGKDQQEGGTWLGVNSRGVAAGLTNYATGKRDPSKASRGNIVLRCLESGHPGAVKGELTPQKTSRYNPFNLFCLSAEAGFLHTNYPSPRTLTIDKGIHVLTNGDMDNQEDPKKKWIRQNLAARTADAIPNSANALMALFSPILTAHDPEDAADICIHLQGYGTVSSCMLFVHHHLQESRYFYCQGPPCRNPYQDLTEDFIKLFRH